MSATEDPDGREHIGDEYVTYNRRKERRPRPEFPPFPPSSKEEEEAHREAETRAKREAERILGDRYERLEGSAKAPIDTETTFRQVINDMLASRHTMSQSLAQVVDRLARVGTPNTQVPHAAQENSGAGSRPQSPSHIHLCE